MPLSEREYMRNPAKTRAEQHAKSARSPSPTVPGRRLMGKPAVPRDTDTIDDSERDHGAREPVRPWGRILRFVLVVVGFGVAGGIAASIVIRSLS